MIETSVNSVILIGFVVQFRPERIKDIAIRFGVPDEQLDDVLGDMELICSGAGDDFSWVLRQHFVDTSQELRASNGDAKPYSWFFPSADFLVSSHLLSCRSCRRPIT